MRDSVQFIVEFFSKVKDLNMTNKIDRVKLSKLTKVKQRDTPLAIEILKTHSKKTQVDIITSQMNSKKKDQIMY